MNNSFLCIESQILCILLAAILLTFNMRSINKGAEYIIKIIRLTLFTSAVDILRVVFDGNAVLVHIFSIAFFASVGFIGYLWLRYCGAQFGIENKLFSWLGLLPAVTVAALTVFSVETGWVYSVKRDGVFCRGNLYYVLLFNLLYVVIAFISACYAAKKADSKREGRDFMITAYCGAPVILSAVLLLLNPDGLTTVTYTVLLSIIIIYNNAQHKQMITDNLTKLQNRYGMDDEIEEQIQQYKKDKNDSFYVIVCDMDNFKTINDTWGHLEGDRALMLIAYALTKAAHKHNSEVFRIGGDEFVIITDKSDSGLGDKVCRSVEKEIDNIDFRDDFTLHMSMGVSLYNGTGTISELINGADKKLYQAKKKKKVGR